MPALFAFRPLVLLDLVRALLPLVLLDLVPVLLPLALLDLMPALLPLALLDLMPVLLPLVLPELVPVLLPVPVDPSPDPEHTKGTISTPIFQEAQPRNKSPDTPPPETETPQDRPTRKVIPFQFFSSHVQEKRPRTTSHHLTLTDHQTRCTVANPTAHRSTNLESPPETCSD